MKVNVVDRNGAGDVFAGAFAYCVLRNDDFEKAVIYASIAASLSVTKVTSRLSIPGISDVSNLYSQKTGMSDEVLNVANDVKQEEVPTQVETPAVAETPVQTTEAPASSDIESL